MKQSLLLACLLCLAFALSACGVDGPPTAPNGTQPEFPSNEQLDINR